MTEKVNFVYVDDNIKAESLINLLSTRKLSLTPFDLETTGLDPYNEDILLMQFKIMDINTSFVINCRRVSWDNQNKIVHSIFRNGHGRLLGQNLKFDLKFLLVKFPDVYFDNVVDTMISEQVLVNGLSTIPKNSLEDLASKYLGKTLSKSTRKQFIGYKGDTFTEEQIKYSVEDVDILMPIHQKQMEFLSEKKLTFIIDIEWRTVPALAKLEVDGIYVDNLKWKSNEDIAKHRKLEIINELNKYALQVMQPDLFGLPSEMNWDSPVKVLNLVRLLISKDIADTSEKTLERINHPFVKLLLDFREQAKLISSYGNSMLALVNPKTGRIHPDYSQLRAKTGRLAASNPNVMQVPKATVVDGDKVKHAIYREAFVPQYVGGKMVGADYSSFELRVLTDLTKEPEWIKGYTEGLDMHSVVASFIFKKPVSKKENPELRMIGKAINFGIAYGMGPKKLADSMSVILKREVTIEEASKVLKSFFEAFPKIREWQNDYVFNTLGLKYMRNPYDGRILIIEGKDMTDRKILSAVTNEIKNFPCQSTNATVLKVALIELTKTIYKNKMRSKVVAPIHDEFLVECESETEAQVMAPLLTGIMKSAASYFIKSVPIEVEPYIAGYWLKD